MVAAEPLQRHRVETGHLGHKKLRHRRVGGLGAAGSGVGVGVHKHNIVPVVGLDELAAAEMHNTVGPAAKAIEDVCGIDDAAAAAVGLVVQELEEPLSDQDVEVDGDLVEKQEVEGLEETHAQLHASSLAVGAAVHAPAGVDLQEVDKLVPPFAVDVAADAADQLVDADVPLGDLVVGPLGAEVDNGLVVQHEVAAQVEGVDAEELDAAASDQLLAGEDLQQRRLACAVGPDKKQLVALLQLHIDVAQPEPLLVGVLERELVGENNVLVRHVVVCWLRPAPPQRTSPGTGSPTQPLSVLFHVGPVCLSLAATAYFFSHFRIFAFFFSVFYLYPSVFDQDNVSLVFEATPN